MERNVMGELNVYRGSGAKPNFSEIARRHGMDRHTVAKYWREGESAADGRSARGSAFDPLEEVIRAKAQLPGMTKSMVGDVSVQTVPPTMLVRAAGREWSVPRRCIGRRVSVIAMPGGQVVVRMAGEEVAVHDAASGPSRPINYDPDHYGQALEGKRGLADADIAEAARANLALLDSLGGA